MNTKLPCTWPKCMIKTRARKKHTDCTRLHLCQRDEYRKLVAQIKQLGTAEGINTITPATAIAPTTGPMSKAPQTGHLL